MATRVMDSYTRPLRIVYESSGDQYYKTRRQWTGLPATATQKLAWPRIGMVDGNGNSLDLGITSISVASPTVVTTDAPHRQVSGNTVFLFGTNSTPSADGAYVVTVIDSTSFSIVLDVTVAGTGGRITWMPVELKEAQSEFAGQLLMEDRTLDSDISKQKIKSISASSVAISFGDGVMPQVIPDAVLNMMPPSWFTDEIITGAVSAEFDVIGCYPAPRRW